MTVRLLHADTGTPCPGLLCEECAERSLLNGNLYFVREFMPETEPAAPS